MGIGPPDRPTVRPPDGPTARPSDRPTPFLAYLWAAPTSFLGLAVPMWIDKMRWWRPAYREQLAHKIGEEIGAAQSLIADENAEGRVPRSERGAVAADFNLIAQGLALLAFCPGGVVFAGHHWEAQQGELPAEAG